MVWELLLLFGGEWLSQVPVSNFHQLNSHVDNKFSLPGDLKPQLRGKLMDTFHGHTSYLE